MVSQSDAYSVVIVVGEKVALDVLCCTRYAGYFNQSNCISDIRIAFIYKMLKCPSSLAVVNALAEFWASLHVNRFFALEEACLH